MGMVRHASIQQGVKAAEKEYSSLVLHIPAFLVLVLTAWGLSMRPWKARNRIEISTAARRMRMQCSCPLSLQWAASVP
jgi:hypothetical protein